MDALSWLDANGCRHVDAPRSDPAMALRVRSDKAGYSLHAIDVFARAMVSSSANVCSRSEGSNVRYSTVGTGALHRM
jgi:hypothetical protein